MTGGGPRNEGGWYAMEGVSLIEAKKTFLSPIYSRETNSFLDGKLFLGFDYRSQITKRPEFDPANPTQLKYERDHLFMQLTPYVTYKPTEEIAIFVGYNLAEPELPGQQEWFAGISYRAHELFAVKGGYILPNFGVRHDDHTSFTRYGYGDFGHRGVGIAPMYAEPGGEVYVYPNEWLTISGGAYSAQNRTDVSRQIDTGSIAFSGKVELLYPDYNSELIYQLGGSMLLYDGQTLIGGHAGFGLLDQGSIQVEYVRREDDFESAGGDPFNPSADVFLVKLNIELIEGLAFIGRYEEAKVEDTETSHSFYKHYVAGLQIFPLPFIEIRPEYRWYDTPLVRISQYTAQFHIFY
ncbi:MAG: hypothetical protein CL946_05445 [Ectothiorhodospiraceae bacterium]|nr:hypothetical protein [Ectothiorhodospiraceae bacterium]